MLGQPRDLLEGFRRGGVDILDAVRPCLRLEGIDRVLAAHEVDIAAAQSIAEFLIFRLGVQADDRLARLTDVSQNQLEQIALALAAVAEDQGPGTGAWTGTLAASLLDMDFKKSTLAVMCGVVLAGIIMGLVSGGVFSFIR